MGEHCDSAMFLLLGLIIGFLCLFLAVICSK